jgi:hypothetical protein
VICYHPWYKYDRVTFLRVDYAWKTPHISVYSLNVAAHTYVGYGAEKFPLIPTLIITDHEGAWKLAKWLVKSANQTTDPLFQGELNSAKINDWLEKVIGRPVELLCQDC